VPEDARDHAQKFAKERKGWLLLTGNYGTGKTHWLQQLRKWRLQIM
jgi:DNA replication protein DnaC